MATMFTDVMKSREFSIPPSDDDDMLIKQRSCQVLARFLEVSDPSRVVPGLVKKVLFFLFKDRGIGVIALMECDRICRIFRR